MLELVRRAHLAEEARLSAISELIALRAERSAVLAEMAGTNNNDRSAAALRLQEGNLAERERQVLEEFNHAASAAATAREALFAAERENARLAVAERTRATTLRLLIAPPAPLAQIHTED